MDHSDDQNVKIEQEIDAFRSIIPQRPKNSPGGHGKIELSESAQQIRKECVNLMNDILEQRIDEMVKKIFDNITCAFTDKQKANKLKNSIVIALNLKRNQKNDLLMITDKFKKLQRDRGTAQQTIETVDIVQIGKEDVRDIALQIQMKEDEKLENAATSQSQKIALENQEQTNVQKRLVIYVIRKVTNLSQQNIHVFDNISVSGKYAVVLPTFESLKIMDGQGIIDETEKYFFQAYNSKELFIEFFYRSIVSRHIMAYLPKEILTLIKIYDYYPISYQDGCNMLMYACQIFDAKRQLNGNPKKKVVQMKELIRIFNRTWRFIWKDESEVNRYNFEVLSHVILNPEADYKVNKTKIFNYLRLYQARDGDPDEELSEKRVYEIFQKKFKEKLAADESLRHLTSVLDEFEANKSRTENIKMKKKTGANREIGLGFTSKVFKDEKKNFEDKITKLFKVATNEVRKQAQYVDWTELNIFELMRPQILRDTVDGIMQESDFRDVFNLIRSHSSFPMARLIESFKRMEIGRLIYILRCLELKGLIELNKNTLKPSLITNFYEKASYRMSGEE